jgi:rRNA processing protein Gar1
MSTRTRTWSPTTHEDYDQLKGMDVFTSDDEKIGSVDEVLHPADNSTAPEKHYLHIKPGMLDKISGDDDMYLRADEVKFIGDDRVMLGLPKNRVESGNWTAPRDVDSFRRR